MNGFMQLLKPYVNQLVILALLLLGIAAVLSIKATPVPEKQLWQSWEKLF
jgi:hypothetical protein